MAHDRLGQGGGAAVRGLGLVGALVAALGGGAACGGTAETEEWPARPITMIVAFGAGRGTDANARIVATLLERELGQPVNVVNRTGGSGVVGHTAIANASPDGYTIGYIAAEVAMMHWAGLTDLTYDRFTPLAMLTGTAGAVLVREDAPYEAIAEVFDAIRTDPGGLQASGSGQGGIWHLTLGGMLTSAGLQPSDVTWVPHQGAAPALADLAADGIDFVVCAPAEARALIAAGRVRAIAVIDERRHPMLPDVPTLAEAVGSDGAVVAWGGVAGPRGMPDAVATRLSEALEQIAETDEFKGLLEARGTGAMYRGPAGFRDYMAESDRRFGRAMRAMGMAARTVRP